MCPAPGRPSTRHRSGRAARDADGFSRRRGSPSPSCSTQRSHPSAHDTPRGTPFKTRRYAPRTHLTSMLFLLSYPHARRSEGSVLQRLHSGTLDWTIEVPLASPAATCSHDDALEVRLDMLMSSPALRAPGVPPTWLHLSIFCASPLDARRQWPHLRGRQVRCTLGMLRSGDTPASTRNSLAGQGTRAPGPAKTGSRAGGWTESLHGSGAECAVVCVANRPQALAPGRTRHCPLQPTKRRLWVSTKPAQRHSGRDAAASEDSTRRPEGP